MNRRKKLKYVIYIRFKTSPLKSIVDGRIIHKRSGPRRKPEWSFYLILARVNCPSSTFVYVDPRPGPAMVHDVIICVLLRRIASGYRSFAYNSQSKVEIITS